MIPASLPPSQGQTANSAGTDLNALLPAGQARTATVRHLQPLPGQGEGYRIEVLIGNRPLALNVPRPIPAGTSVSLTRDAGGQINIAPMPAGRTAPAPSGTAPRIQSVEDAALRTSLPLQQPVAAVLNGLSGLTLPASPATQQLDLALQSLLQLFGIRPGHRDGTAAVRRNIEQGGFFTEAALARAREQGPPPLDIKARLGQLLQLSEQLPPQAREQLQKLIDSLLARVTTRQLGSAQQNRELPDGSSDRHFALDLPVRVGERFDNVALYVLRHRATERDDGQNGYWRIRLHFDLEALGSLDAELHLGDDARVSARFWAAEADTAMRVQQRLDSLGADLGRQGLQVDTLSCHQGSAPRAKTGIDRQLINLRT